MYSVYVVFDDERLKFQTPDGQVVEIELLEIVWFQQI